MPSANRLYEQLKPRGLELLLVNFREDANLVRRTAHERGYVARVVLDATGDTTGRVYGVFGTPTFYVIDREGRLVGRAVGPHDWESAAMRRLLETLLRAPRTSVNPVGRDETMDASRDDVAGVARRAQTLP